MQRTGHHIKHHVSHHGRYDGNANSEGFRCVEVMTDTRRRREWSADEKLSIIAESFSARTSISAVARRHGINKNQLFQWRRLFREGAFGQVGAEAVEFVPVITDVTGAAENSVTAPRRTADDGPVGGATIEIVIGTTTVRVPPSADERTLRRVLAAVAGLERPVCRSLGEGR